MLRASAHLAELTVERFVAAFALEVGKAYMINFALSKAMNRIAEAVVREATTDPSLSAADVLTVLSEAFRATPLGGDAR